MTDRERAAYRAALRHAADMALLSAISLELRPDAAHTRQQAAIAAPRGLAAGLKGEATPQAETAPEDALARVMWVIAVDPATSGAAVCPTCAGRFVWIKDAGNGHIHARCEGAGCHRVMQ